MRESIRDMTARFNPLAAFLEDDNEVVYEVGAEVEKGELERRIKSYMQIHKGIRSYDTSDIDNSIRSYTKNRVTRAVKNAYKGGRTIRVVVFQGLRVV